MKLYDDLVRYSNGAKYPKGLVNPIFYINVNFRISNFFAVIKLYPIAKLFWFVNRVLFSVDIDPRASIDGGFVIKHGLGVVIGAYAKIGENFTIYQGATIGGNSGLVKIYNGIELKQPLIGDNVVIGPNAVVIGPLVIKGNCQVGAGSIITKDIAEGDIVVGNNKTIGNRNSKLPLNKSY